MFEYKVVKEIWTEESLQSLLNLMAQDGWAIAGTLGGFIILERLRSNDDAVE